MAEIRISTDLMEQCMKGSAGPFNNSYGIGASGSNFELVIFGGTKISESYYNGQENNSVYHIDYWGQGQGGNTYALIKYFSRPEEWTWSTSDDTITFTPPSVIQSTANRTGTATWFCLAQRHSSLPKSNPMLFGDVTDLGGAGPLFMSDRSIVNGQIYSLKQLSFKFPRSYSV